MKSEFKTTLLGHAKVSSQEYGRLKFFASKGEAEVSDKSSVTSHEAYGPFGSIVSREVSFNDYGVCRVDYHIERQTTIHVACGNPLIMLAYVHRNNIRYKLADQQVKTLRKYQYTLVYLDQLDADLVFEPGEYSIILFLTTMEFLQRWSDCSTLLAKFLSRVAEQRIVKMSEQYPWASTQMLATIRETTKSLKSASLGRMYLEAKILDVLRMAIEGIIQLRASPRAVNIRDDDRKKIESVRDFLTRNPDNPGTLVDLARRFGLNDFKLKSGFKQLYGTTVFSFLMDLRFSKARILLTESDLPIKVVAGMAGYRNPTNFSSAFKKRFGYPPGKVKRKGNG